MITVYGCCYMKIKEYDIKDGAINIGKPRVNRLNLLVLLIGFVLTIYSTCSKGVPVSQNDQGHVLYSEQVESSGGDSLFFMGFAAFPFYATAILCMFLIHSRLASIVLVCASQVWLYFMLFLVNLDVPIGNALLIGDYFLVTILFLSLGLWALIVKEIQVWLSLPIGEKIFLKPVTQPPKSEMDSFFARMQEEAKRVGMTEDDIQQAIKAVRHKKS
jgi:hypothetical protein